MSSTLDASLTPTLLFAALIAFVVLRRAYRMYSGTAVQPAQLFLLAGLYLVLFGLLSVFESLPLLPIWSLFLDVGIVAAAAVGGMLYVERHVEIYESAGRWMFKIGLLVPVVYLGMFVLRLVLETVVVGINPFDPPTTLPVLSPVGSTTLILVDALFAFSTGLVVGRNVGVYRAYERRLRASPSGSPSPPLPGAP